MNPKGRIGQTDDLDAMRDSVAEFATAAQLAMKTIAALRGQVSTLREALQGITNDCEYYINDEDGPGPVQTMQAMREAARAALTATAAPQDQEARHE